MHVGEEQNRERKDEMGLTIVLVASSGPWQPMTSVKSAILFCIHVFTCVKKKSQYFIL